MIVSSKRLFCKSSSLHGHENKKRCFSYWQEKKYDQVHNKTTQGIFNNPEN